MSAATRREYIAVALNPSRSPALRSWAPFAARALVGLAGWRLAAASRSAVVAEVLFCASSSSSTPAPPRRTLRVSLTSLGKLSRRCRRSLPRWRRLVVPRWSLPRPGDAYTPLRAGGSQPSPSRAGGLAAAALFHLSPPRLLYFRCALRLAGAVVLAAGAGQARRPRLTDPRRGRRALDSSPAAALVGFAAAAVAAGRSSASPSCDVGEAWLAGPAGHRPDDRVACAVGRLLAALVARRVIVCAGLAVSACRRLRGVDGFLACSAGRPAW